MTFTEMINRGKKILEYADIGPEGSSAAGNSAAASAGREAARDAELLLMYVTGKSRMYLFMHNREEADAQQEKLYFEMIGKRAEGEPLQYITGQQEFMGLTFRVSEAVLIPRQDTETLVELALEKAGAGIGKTGIGEAGNGNEAGAGKAAELLDMCCGSGAIAVSMAHYMPQAQVTACDLSEAALAVAAENAAALGVAGRVRTVRSDMFRILDEAPGCDGKILPEEGFDMILSNPPYIPSEVIEGLQTEVRDHEPMMALDGGDDGLVFYRIIAGEAYRYLRDGGQLLMEIGHDQAAAVTKLLEDEGRYGDIHVYKDLAGLDRVVYCKRI